MSENLENWIERISKNELPIFKYTVNSINEVVSKEESSIFDLSQIILRDANLTARILRLANSVAYNTTGLTISTVSRAIVYLGFNLVRDLSMSLAIIDALLSGKAKKKALELMAKSFHAAVQAKNFSERRGDDNVEEVFIAALLRQVGEITFWCVAGEEGEQIIEIMEKKSLSAKKAQKEVLGFTLDQLTVALTRGWHLSDLLHSAIEQPKMANPRVQDIVLALTFSEKTSESWSSKETLSTAYKIAKHIGVKKDQILSILKENAESAAKVAKSFGAESIIEYLPIDEPQVESGSDEHVFDEYCPIADPLLQLNILRDLSGILMDKPNFNLILEVVLEGIYRGVGLDRTVFALMTSDKKAIKAKHALGKDNQDFISLFHFSLQTDNIFSKVLKTAESRWIKAKKTTGFTISNEIRSKLNSDEFYLAPLVLSGTSIGLIYADRQPSGRALDNESYESFKHFVQQACLALAYISPK